MLSPVRLLSVCCLSVTFGTILSRLTFSTIFFAVWYLIRGKFFGHRCRGTLPLWGFNARGVAKYSDYDIWKAISRKRCKIAGRLVLITDRKSYVSFRMVPKSVTLNGEMALIMRYFTEFGSFRAYCVKVVDKAITMDNLRLLCLVVNVCRGTVLCPRYKCSITARWKFCSRFINSRRNAQYLPSYCLDRKSYMRF